MNYAAVLERFGGEREAVSEVGCHIRLAYFTRIEQEVSLMNQRLFLSGIIESMRMISKENAALWTSALLTYRIRDLHTCDIENLATSRKRTAHLAEPTPGNPAGSSASSEC
jgi:regulator of protease activity HflC (stomatin/prohibitin superfamily)